MSDTVDPDDIANINPSDLSDRKIELEWIGRRVVDEWNNVIDYTTNGSGDIVFTNDSTQFGLFRLGGPVFYDGTLVDFLSDELGLTITGVKVVDEPFTAEEYGFLSPSDVDIDLDKSQADMDSIRQKFVRKQLSMKIVCELTDPTL